MQDGSAKGTWGIGKSRVDVVRFWVGVAMWVGGFVSNIVCDEILYDLKRKKKAGRTLRESGGGGTGNGAKARERYSIPQGFLYRYVSHPAYFVEWIEWTGTSRLGLSSRALA